MNRSCPTVARLTPSGRGAIATLAVSGPGSIALVDRLVKTVSGRSLAETPKDRIVLGRLIEKKQPGEQIVVTHQSDDAVLLHCHGGMAAVARIQQRLIEHGAQPIDWNEWSQENHQNWLQHEAAIALSEAKTERTAAILLDQYQGALQNELTHIRTAIVENEVEKAVARLDALLGLAPLGLHLTCPWRVVLAGPPNVGKSSLINALVGFQRAIVHPTPGTTRDVLRAMTAIDGWEVEFRDTAGLRRGEHAVEQAGIDRAQSELSTADLVVLVFDATAAPTEETIALQQAWPEAIVVLNKSDLLPPTDDIDEPSKEQAVRTLTASALTGEGLDCLIARISDRLVPNPPAPGAAVCWTERQVDHVRAAWRMLTQGNRDLALKGLLEIELPST